MSLCIVITKMLQVAQKFVVGLERNVVSALFIEALRISKNKIENPPTRISSFSDDGLTAEEI